MARELTPDEEFPHKRRVAVLAAPAEAVTQPDDFHICPLGIQFYAPSPVDPFTVMEVDIDIPGAHGSSRRITCTGAVVHCAPEKRSGLHRIWLQFLDLPDGVRECLRCTAREGKFLCPYCQNF